MIDLDDPDPEAVAACGVGWLVADGWEDWRLCERHEALLAELAASAASAPKPRRIRKPTLASQLRQVWKAARAAGIPITVTIEGESGKLTATPVKGAAVAAADSDFNEWDRDLGTHPPEVRQ